MLVVCGEEPFEDAGVSDLPGLLKRGDVLVFNDTRVIPAQLEAGVQRIATLQCGSTSGAGRPSSVTPSDCVRARQSRSAEAFRRQRKSALPMELRPFLSRRRTGRSPARAGRAHAAAALYRGQACDGCAGSRGLPDYVRARGRSRRRADCRAAFYPPPIGRAGCGGCHARDADAACRSGDFPAGQGRRYRRPCDAFRMGSDRARDGRAPQCGACSWRAGHRRRHHQPAPARKRHARRWRNPSLRR